MDNATYGQRQGCPRRAARPTRCKGGNRRTRQARSDAGQLVRECHGLIVPFNLMLTAGASTRKRYGPAPKPPRRRSTRKDPPRLSPTARAFDWSALARPPDAALAAPDVCSLLYALGENPGTVMDEMGHTDPALALRVYRQAMRRDDGEKAQLRALVEGGDMAEFRPTSGQRSEIEANGEPDSRAA